MRLEVEMEYLSLANIKEMINNGAVEGVENWRFKNTCFWLYKKSLPF